ncbi:hypothetical protein D9M68_975090 [compost metagenome]
MLDHFAVDRHPATLDVQLRFPARAAGEFDKAFGQADGVGHGGSQGRGKAAMVNPITAQLTASIVARMKSASGRRNFPGFHPGYRLGRAIP